VGTRRRRALGCARGYLYRSVELNHLQDDDLEAFGELRIRTVFDFRTAAERSAEADVLPEDTELIVCDVLKDSQSGAPAQLMKVLSDPSLAEQILGDGKAVRLFEKGYRGEAGQQDLRNGLIES
jgi:protein-tyrosine phosphatase